MSLGDDFEDRDLVSDYIYALDRSLLGSNNELIVGVIGQADSAFLNSEVVTASGEVSITMTAPGGDKIQGQAKSSGQYSLQVEWLDADLNVVRREGIISNREGGVWSNYSLDPKSPYVKIIVVNDTASEQTVDMTGHYR